ncbi:hypothetical protein ABZ079_09245 [Streptomyces sp. NPDC006314]|uniref:hypothetical protein n=1 Tax=Streptomyces sp. NPDC006314 TaxID=3154475 RepID=UPI0033A1DEF9
MLRGTTTRALLALLAVALLALQLCTPTGTFAPAHTLGHSLAKAETGIISSAMPERERTDTVRDPGRSGEPVGIAHVRARQRGSASGWAQEHPPITGRAAEAGSPDTSGTPRDRSSRAARAHTPAALQVFRC